MEFGLQVERTPFIPIKFRSEKDISSKQIAKLFNLKPKNMRIVYFTLNPITETDSNIETKYFNVLTDGFPCSAEFLLFKFFVSQSLITNHLMKIAVVSVGGYIASSYCITRWLIDERGYKYSQAIQALKKSLSLDIVEDEIKDRISRMYSYEGTPIFLKIHQLPIEKGETDFNSTNQTDNQNLNENINTYQNQKPSAVFDMNATTTQLQKQDNSEPIYQTLPSQSSFIKSQNPKSYYVSKKNNSKTLYDLPNQYEEIQFLNVDPKSNSHRHHHHEIKQQSEVNINENSQPYQYEYNQEDAIKKSTYPQPYQYEYKQQTAESSNINTNVYDDYYQQSPNEQNYQQQVPNEQEYSQQPNYVLHHNYHSYELQDNPDIRNNSYDYQNGYYPNYGQSLPPNPQPQAYHQHQYPSYYQYDNDYQNINSYRYNDRPTNYIYDDQQNINSYQYDRQNLNLYQYDQQTIPSHLSPPNSAEYRLRMPQYDRHYLQQYQDHYRQGDSYPYPDMYRQEYYHNTINPQFLNDRREYHDTYNQPHEYGPIRRYPQDINIIRNDIANPENIPELLESETPPFPPRTENSRSLQLLADEPDELQSSLPSNQLESAQNNESIPLYTSSLLNSSEGIDSDESNHELKDSQINLIEPSIDTIDNSHNVDHIFSRIPMSRIGEDASFDEYSEVCKDIASYLSIKNVNLQNIQSLPFSIEEQLTVDSFSYMINHINKSIVIRPIPDGVRCFLVVRGSKRFLISNEICREVKVSLYSPNNRNVTKSLFEGFLVRYKFDQNPHFIITDCFYSDIDLSDFQYKSRLVEAKKMVESQQLRSDDQDILLNVIETFPISRFEEFANKLHLGFEILGFSFLSPNATRQPCYNQFNLDGNNFNFHSVDSIYCNKVFRWFRDGCPIVEISIDNSMKCIGLARRNDSDDLVKAVDFGFAKKTMLRFNKKIVELEYSPNLSKWQIKCISSNYKTWYADDVKNIVCGKEVMTYAEVKQKVSEFIKKTNGDH